MSRRCKGNSCPYGFGHHDEHVRAAKLGWRRRREGEARYVGHVFGDEYELHRHAGHFMLRSTADNSHFELSSEEFHQLTAQMRAEKREAETERKFQREVARLARIAAPKQSNFRDAQRELREYERAKRDAERLERHRQRELEAERRLKASYRRDELYTAIRSFSSSGKIKAYRGGHEKEEFQAIPVHFRARRGESGLTPDEVAAHLKDHAPWLGIETDSDLFDAFNMIRVQRQNRKAA